MLKTVPHPTFSPRTTSAITTIEPTIIEAVPIVIPI